MLNGYRIHSGMHEKFARNKVLVVMNTKRKFGKIVDRVRAVRCNTMCCV